MQPTKIYAEYVDGATLDQFYTAIKQPFVLQSALMPDAHLGYSLPIGAVVATDNVVVPAWVGYDIGCGMCAMPTGFMMGEVDANAEEIYERIIKTVPVGFNHNSQPRDISLPNFDISPFLLQLWKEQAAMQVGTLGGGNHFIELGYDESHEVWVVIHSGSRGVGYKLAEHYMRNFDEYLQADSPEGLAYTMDAYACQTFALQNRLRIMKDVVEQMSKVLGRVSDSGNRFINRNHNHVERTTLGFVHRKGATHAEDNMMGVIPGNMRDGSFIVIGKGNPDSLCSSSHGAGRVMSRRKAKQLLDVDEFQRGMVGIVCNASENTLDESPMAYKDIFEVMEQQRDLVEVVHHIKPLINVKG